MFHKKNILKQMMVLGLLASLGLVAPLGASPALAAGPSYLGTAADFAVLGGSTVTNTGASVITGNLGVSPGAAVTGFPPGLVTPPGTIHAADAVALQAQSDTTTAYNTLAGRACNTDLTGQDLGGLTLTPGIYCFSSSAQLTGTLTLDAQGNPNAAFIFQIGSTLTTATNSSVLVINAGSDCGVSWQVGSSATLGTTTAFAGNILALTSITLNTGANVSGRTLARNGAVTLDTNAVSSAVCDSYAGTGLPTGSITLVKTVTNDDGGSALPTAWTLSATGPTTISGATGSAAVTNAEVSAGSYTIGESGGPLGYTATYSCVINSGAPVASNIISLAAGDTATCTINNNDLVPATAVPTLNEWGTIFFMLLAGLGSVYYLRKYRRV